MFLLFSVQEIWLIQIVHREDNIDFTIRFMERFPPSGMTYFVRYIPHCFSLVILVSFWLFIGETPNIQGWYITCLLFFIFIRITDPILGCINTYESKPWMEILAYIGVYVFAVVSAVSPEKFSLIPSEFTIIATLSVLSVVVLQLRMAYYDYFCFQREYRLQGQLKFIIIALLFISIPRLLSVVQNISGNING